MARCLVTGGAGFIGSHVVEALVAQGEQVRVVDNLSSGRLDNLAGIIDQIEFLEADVRDGDAVEAAMAGVAYVFHLAAMVSVPQSMVQPGEAELINAYGTLNVLEAARTAGVRRVVFSSTCAIYGDDPALPKTEGMAPAPQSPYAISKLAAEQYCRLFDQAYGLETVVLRYFNVYGPRQDPSSPYSGVISIFIDRMARGEPVTIFGDGEQTRDFVQVGDVVQANLVAAIKPEAGGQLLNIGTGRGVSINHIFDSLSRVLGYGRRPDYRAARPGDVRHSYADVSQARLALDWRPGLHIEQGLQRLAINLL